MFTIKQINFDSEHFSIPLLFSFIVFCSSIILDLFFIFNNCFQKCDDIIIVSNKNQEILHIHGGDCIMNSEIMNIKEVAEFLQVKEQTVYRLVQTGKIPALKIGGQWKVKKSHLDKMFDNMLDKTISNMKA